jgi:hypothetical protein
MLDIVKNTIHDSPERTKSAMNNFLYTVGISYLPLHEKAVETAKEVGTVEVKRDKKSSFLNAYESIQRDIDRRKLGFKRKYVRC